MTYKQPPPILRNLDNFPPGAFYSNPSPPPPSPKIRHNIQNQIKGQIREFLTISLGILGASLSKKYVIRLKKYQVKEKLNECFELMQNFFELVWIFNTTPFFN